MGNGGRDGWICDAGAGACTADVAGAGADADEVVVVDVVLDACVACAATPSGAARSSEATYTGSAPVEIDGRVTRTLPSKQLVAGN